MGHFRRGPTVAMVAVAGTATRKVRPDMEAAAQTAHATIVNQSSKAVLARSQDIVPQIATYSAARVHGPLAKANRLSDTDPEPGAIAQAACSLHSQSWRPPRKKGGRIDRPIFGVADGTMSLA